MMKKIYFILLMAMLVSVSVGQTKGSQSAAVLLKRANDLYVKGKFSKAIILYRKSVKRGAPPVATSINIGNCYYRMQKLSDAAASFRKAVRISGGASTTALFNLAGVLYHLKQYGESIAVYHRALDLDPKNAGAWLYIAEAYTRTKDFVGAQRALEKARNLDPEDITIVYQLAEVHVSLKEYDEAVKLVRSAYNRNPEEIDYLYYIGDLYRIAGDDERAASAYKEGLAVEPNKYSILYKLADVLARDNKPFLAMEYLQKALVAKPDYDDAAIFLGNLAFDEQWWDRAEEYYLMAANRSDEGLQGLKNLAYEYEHNGDIDRGIQLLEEAYGISPKDRMLKNELQAIKDRKNEI